VPAATRVAGAPHHVAALRAKAFQGEICMSEYLGDVQRYDAGASGDIVAKIVKHLGIALRNRDSAIVSCSDQSELDRVREKWCEKKLGVLDAARNEKIIQIVCETMKADRNKQRVTFYYLVAKHHGKLGEL
jgi:Protein of unknown function (DUF2853)